MEWSVRIDNVGMGTVSVWWSDCMHDTGTLNQTGVIFKSTVPASFLVLVLAEQHTPAFTQQTDATSKPQCLPWSYQCIASHQAQHSRTCHLPNTQTFHMQSKCRILCLSTKKGGT